MKPIPLLIMGDAPTSGTGLGRISRDLATRIYEHMKDTFRVGTLGCAGTYSRGLGFPQYDMLGAEFNKFIPPRFVETWLDFAGDEQGVVLTIWDASRLLWFTRPEFCPDLHIKNFLEEQRFLKWGYLPIDATGPNDRLTGVLKETLVGYDRLLAYSKWGQGVVERTLKITGNTFSLNWLPHGIDTSVFRPRDNIQARLRFPLKAKDAFMVGIVAANQRRKDFGLGIDAVSQLSKENTRLWINTDRLNNDWCIEDLLRDFGLLDRTMVTLGGLTDEQLSWYYSACNVTLGIGSGEGFGYPIAESMACGVPCIHGRYGGAEYVPDEFAVMPLAFRTEGIYGAQRPVFQPCDWTQRMSDALGKKTSLPLDLDWEILWPRWERWLREGVE